MKYRFDVGIEGNIPDQCDDLFQAEIELTDEEYQQLYAAFVKYSNDGDDMTCIQDYVAPDFDVKLCALVEPFAIAKYGKFGRLDSGARYELYPTKELEDVWVTAMRQEE